MKKLKFMFIALATSLLPGCQSNDEPAINPDVDDTYNVIELSSNATRAVAENNKFAEKLFQYQCTKPNSLISPYSLFSLLSMVANGDNGETRDEILNTILGKRSATIEDCNELNSILLKELPKHDRHTAVNISNSIWIDNSVQINPDFESAMSKYYQADFFTQYLLCSDEARNAINQWSSQKTNGMIDNLLDDNLDKSQKMSAINCVYFNSKWDIEFDPDLTSKQSFRNLDDTYSTVDMMKLAEEHISYSQGDNYESVALKYNKGNFEMRIILPDENEDFTQFVKTIDLDAINSNEFKMKSLTLEMPKFEASYSITYKNALADIGIKKAFDYNFGFNNLCSQQVAIGEIIQKCIIKVNEKGTEVAAATIIGDVIAPEPPKVVKLNRPFIYTISETSTGTILFIGTVTNL